MSTFQYLGIDLAKNVLQLCGLSKSRNVVLQKGLRRNELSRVFARIEACTIGVEACAGAFYWQRQFEELGHSVKVISPQYVKPFTKEQKNDFNDARGHLKWPPFEAGACHA